MGFSRATRLAADVTAYVAEGRKVAIAAHSTLLISRFDRASKRPGSYIRANEQNAACPVVTSSSFAAPACRADVRATVKAGDLSVYRLPGRQASRHFRARPDPTQHSGARCSAHCEADTAPYQVCSAILCYHLLLFRYELLHLESELLVPCERGGRGMSDATCSNESTVSLHRQNQITRFYAVSFAIGCQAHQIRRLRNRCKASESFGQHHRSLVCVAEVASGSKQRQRRAPHLNLSFTSTPRQLSFNSHSTLVKGTIPPIVDFRLQALLRGGDGRRRRRRRRARRPRAAVVPQRPPTARQLHRRRSGAEDQKQAGSGRCSCLLLRPAVSCCRVLNTHLQLVGCIVIHEMQAVCNGRKSKASGPRTSCRATTSISGTGVYDLCKICCSGLRERPV